MRKVFMLLMAASAILFAGCSKSNTDPSDPSSPSGETISINKQWSFHLNQTVKYMTYDLSTANQIVYATSYDETTYYKDVTYPVSSITYSNNEKTAGTITYTMPGGPTTLKFQNLTAGTCDFDMNGTPGYMVGMYETFQATTHELKTR